MAQKTLTGKIISDKMQKTVVVAIDIPTRHPIYNKLIKNTKKFLAHNELGAKTGQQVVIGESKPFSKRVTWKVLEILKDKGE